MFFIFDEAYDGGVSISLAFGGSRRKIIRLFPCRCDVPFLSARFGKLEVVSQ
jgi:hypothetical protein